MLSRNSASRSDVQIRRQFAVSRSCDVLAPGCRRDERVDRGLHSSPIRLGVPHPSVLLGRQTHHLVALLRDETGPPGIRGAAHVRRRRGVGHPGAAAARQRGSRGGTGARRACPPASRWATHARIPDAAAMRLGPVRSRGVVSATSLASFPPFIARFFGIERADDGDGASVSAVPEEDPPVFWRARWWARWAMDGPRRAPARRRSRVGRWRRPRTAATGGVAAGSGACALGPLPVYIPLCAGKRPSGSVAWPLIPRRRRERGAPHKQDLVLGALCFGAACAAGAVARAALGEPAGGSAKALRLDRLFTSRRLRERVGVRGGRRARRGDRFPDRQVLGGDQLGGFAVRRDHRHRRVSETGASGHHAAQPLTDPLGFLTRLVTLGGRPC